MQISQKSPRYNAIPSGGCLMIARGKPSPGVEARNERKKFDSKENVFVKYGDATVASRMRLDGKADFEKLAGLEMERRWLSRGDHTFSQ